MVTVDDVESYARSQNADIMFCRGIVFRLKSIGITDEQVLYSAILSQTRSSFDEIFSRFGREIAVYVTSLTRDQSLPRQHQERQFTEQLQNAPWESILIKLCEISANFKTLKESEMSKTRRSKVLKQNIRYLNMLKRKISINRDRTPGIKKLLYGINETLTYFKYKPIEF